MISDYHLDRGESGTYAIVRVRAAVGREVPAILMSGDTSGRVRAETASLANCVLMTKPTDTDELIETAERLLAGRARD